MNRDRRERKVWKLLPWPKFGLFSCAGETVCSAAPPAITMDARERDKEFIILLQAGGDGSSLELWNFPRPNVKSISWKRFTGHIEGYLETARSSGIRLYLQSSGLQHFNLFPLKRLKGTIKRQFPGFKGDGWIWSLSMALYVITGKRGRQYRCKNWERVKRSYSEPADRNIPLLRFGGSVLALLSREAGLGLITAILQTPVAGSVFPGTGAWSWKEGKENVTAFHLQQGQPKVQLYPWPVFYFPQPCPSPAGSGCGCFCCMLFWRITIQPRGFAFPGVTWLPGHTKCFFALYNYKRHATFDTYNIPKQFVSLRFWLRLASGHGLQLC